jgi:formamidopyrimidine-DNA glycosylase
MPELPEVETVRRDLTAVILHQKIKSVKILSQPTIKNSPALFLRILKNNEFVKIERIGKLLIFNLANGKNYLLVHLKMTGQLIYDSGKNVVVGGHSLNKNRTEEMVKPQRSTRVYFIFADGSRLFFNDQRRFGYLKIVDYNELEKIKSKYGLEPLTPEFKKDKWRQIFSGRKKNVKALLLDQSLVAGVGNIYADEVLFASGILPNRLANSLKLVEIDKIFKNLQIILARAIAERGTTFNNYVDGHGRKGGFVNFLKVYGRKGQNCKKCKTPLKSTKVAGRGTIYCIKCQK